MAFKAETTVSQSFSVRALFPVHFFFSGFGDEAYHAVMPPISQTAFFLLLVTFRGGVSQFLSLSLSLSLSFLSFFFFCVGNVLLLSLVDVDKLCN